MVAVKKISNRVSNKVSSNKVSSSNKAKATMTKKIHKRHTIKSCNGLPSFNTYIRKLLSTLNPKIGMNSKSLAEVEYMTHYIITRLSESANMLLNNQTLQVDEIRDAIPLAFPSQITTLIKSSIQAGDSAVESYKTNTSDPAFTERKATREQRAGLIFRLSRCKHSLKILHNYKRIGETAPIFLAAVLEHIVSKILESSFTFVQQSSRSRISSKHLVQAIHSDDNLRILFNDVILSGGLPVA